jgi:hypothetical protein
MEKEIQKKRFCVFKGTDGYFFKGLNILISTFCVCAVILVPTSHWLCEKKMPNNCLVTGGFRHDFTESQAASCKHFQSL